MDMGNETVTVTDSRRLFGGRELTHDRDFLAVGIGSTAFVS